MLKKMLIYFFYCVYKKKVLPLQHNYALGFVYSIVFLEQFDNEYANPRAYFF